MQLIRVIEKNHKHLVKIINVDEMSKLIFYNIHSNYASCRALTLRALAEIASIIGDNTTCSTRYAWHSSRTTRSRPRRPSTLPTKCARCQSERVTSIYKMNSRNEAVFIYFCKWSFFRLSTHRVKLVCYIAFRSHLRNNWWYRVHARSKNEAHSTARSHAPRHNFVC